MACQLEAIKLQNKIVYFDLNDILDILISEDNKNNYTIVFNDGEIWYNVNLKKTTINKFIKTKKKRGQKDGKV